MIQILQVAKDTTNVTKEVVSAIASGHTDLIIEKLIDMCISAGKNILIAIIVYIVGRFLISLIQRVMGNMLSRRKVEISIQTFLKSLVSILLNVLLIVSVVGALGDWIEAQNVSGSVTAIQIMHTLVTTADNKVVYIPNGAMSSGVITNYSRLDTRRVEWIVGVDYGEDIDKVKSVVNELIQKDNRILKEPAPVIALHALDSSSVNVTIRAWVANGDYWNVYFEMNKNIYDEFNRQGIDFPFPQMTIHQA